MTFTDVLDAAKALRADTTEKNRSRFFAACETFAAAKGLAEWEVRRDVRLTLDGDPVVSNLTNRPEVAL